MTILLILFLAFQLFNRMGWVLLEDY